MIQHKHAKEVIIGAGKQQVYLFPVAVRLQSVSVSQGPHEGDLLDNKVTAQRIEAALRGSGAEFKQVKVEATKDGVTLTGKVKSKEEKTRAEELAKSIGRDMELKNELQVRE